MSLLRRPIHYFLLISLFFINSSFAFSQRLTTEDFKKFNRLEQEEFIKSTQDFFIQLEQMQKEDIRTANRYKTVQVLLEKIVSKSYAQKISTHKHLCIYAGWISYIPKNQAKGRCRHPMTTRMSEVPKELKDVIAAEYKRYKATLKSFKGKKCPNPADIICNNQIFGRAPDNSPYCVEGNRDSENSSYACLKNFHKHEKKNLDYIIELNKNDKSAERRLDRLMGMIDDACMCAGPNNLIDQNYARRMFKTQTCFAWVSQARNIAKRACSIDTKASKPLSSFVDLSKKLYNKANKELVKAGITADKYIELIQEDRKWSKNDWKKHRLKYEEFCKAEPALKAQGEDHKDPKLYIVKGTVTGVKNFDPKALKFEIPKDKNSQEKQKPGLRVLKRGLKPYPVKVSYEHLTDTVTVPPLAKEEKNHISISKEDDDKKYIFTATPQVKKSCKLVEIKWLINGEPSEEFKVEELKDKNEKLPIKVSLPKEKVTKDIKVKAQMIVDCPKAKNSSVDSKEIEVPATDNSGADISIKKGTLTGDQQEVIAKVTIDGKEITEDELKEGGFIIEWFIKDIVKDQKDDKKDDKDKKPKVDASGMPIEEEERNESEKPNDGLGTTDKKTDDKKEDEYKKFDSSGESLKTDKVKIKENEQEVMAKLVKNQIVLKDSNIEKIDPKKKPTVNQRPNGPPMRGPVRPSMMGNRIIRGIR